MAKYSDIKGFTVQTLSTDPAASVAASGSWASGGNLNAKRYGAFGFGIQTSAILATGFLPPPTTNVEQYDGSTWTEVNNVNTQRELGGAAGATAAEGIIFGGSPGSNKTETEDGMD